MSNKEYILELQENCHQMHEQIVRLKIYIKDLEEDLYKHRKVLIEIQLKAMDILRPIPFQDEE